MAAATMITPSTCSVRGNRLSGAAKNSRHPNTSRKPMAQYMPLGVAQNRSTNRTSAAGAASAMMPRAIMKQPKIATAISMAGTPVMAPMATPTVRGTLS